MSALLLAAAASFLCLAPSHHDGDNIRCRNYRQSMRLYGIDAPEMPGACRPGRQCVRGNPFASRDYLKRLTAGRNAQCTILDIDRYARPVVRCTAGGVDLSCAMIRARYAVPRYGRLAC
jgi:endonuclease YncB( thermonuclease family)